MPLIAPEDRAGLPEDLRVLLARYPRALWPGHANLGAMAQFWLSRHAMFRELGGMLDAATGKYRGGALTPRDFADYFAPRLQFLLSQLHAHHMIEDHHYFPIFRAADKRLAPGFEILDNDHVVLHRHIEQSAETANAVLAALDAEKDQRSRAIETYASASARLLRSLGRHLDDEEDLIVPLILDRGEGALGVG